MRRALETLVVVLVVLTVLIAGVVIFTVQTSFTADEVRQWFDATGGALGAAAAVVVALFGFRQQRLQAEDALRTSLDQVRLAGDEVARSRRVKLYEDALEIATLENPPDAVVMEMYQRLSLYGSRNVLEAWTNWQEARLKRAEARPGISPSVEHLDLQLALARQRFTDALRAELAPD